MKRTLIAAFICFSLIFGGSLPAAAAEQVSQATAIQVLKALEIMVGDETGNLNLSADVTRAEFAKMLVAASVQKDQIAAVANASPFRDVSYQHWAASYIKTAVGQGWLTGYLDGTYRPDQTITLEEAVSGTLKLLGYGTSDFSGSYPYGQLALAETLGLTKQVGASQGGLMSRQDMLYLFYHLLSAKTKEGETYLETLGYAVDETGAPDYLSLMEKNLKGPYIVESGLAELGIDAAGATVYKNGTLAENANVTTYDVVYYSPGLQTIWIYSNAVTGTCQSISESIANPSSVTVAGKTYALATSEAKLAFSSMGTLRTGDTVTLLLGMDQKAVAAIPSASYQSVAATLYGIVTNTATESYTNANGENYTSYTVTVLATDGNEYRYPVTTSYDADTLVKVSVFGSSTKVEKVSALSMSGTVNEDGTSFDTTPLASNVEILDTYGSQGIRVYSSRLQGAFIDASYVRYYSKNSNGEIDRLILNDYTGDIHQYGVVTEANETVTEDSDIPSFGQYLYDIAGSAGSYGSSSVIMNAEEGPAVFKTKNGSLAQIKNLKKRSLDSVDALYGYEDNTSYPLWESVSVYLLDEEEYHYASLGVIQNGDYTLTGYYDKSAANGGRIRVIVAQPNA